MKTEKTTGLLLILGAIGVFVPYTFLTLTFEYPHILRQEAGIILTKFRAGGTSLLLTWWAFALLGLPLLIAYVQIGQLLASRMKFMKWVTTIGVISGIVQIIGLLRWVFVVPLLAKTYVTSPDPATKEASKLIFLTIHQFGGVLLGEHLGQLFTIIWSLAICFAFLKIKYLPKWVHVFGILVALIYLIAQAELATTIIPGFPYWDLAGLIGSTLWLVWLIILGIQLLYEPLSDFHSI